jgi:hypothetical protein
LKYFLQNKVEVIPKPSRTKPYKMSQSVELKAAVVVETPVVVKKPVVSRKIKIKDAPVVVAAVTAEPTPTQALFNKSIWLLMRRNPKEKPLPIVWEHVEDISDDENDTPQAAGKRLSNMKATRDHMQRRAYERKFDEYQCAGLFLNWSKPKPIEVHSRQRHAVHIDNKINN